MFEGGTGVSEQTTAGSEQPEGDVQIEDVTGSQEEAEGLEEAEPLEAVEPEMDSHAQVCCML